MINFSYKTRLEFIKNEMIREIEQRLSLNEKLTDNAKLFRYRYAEELLKEFIERIAKT